jgi:hypothetical protein
MVGRSLSIAGAVSPGGGGRSLDLPVCLGWLGGVRGLAAAFSRRRSFSAIISGNGFDRAGDLYPMARIYISSTYEDLKEERRRASDAILSVGHLPVKMETYTASERPPLEHCLNDVRSCQIYLGIFAFRYGYMPPGQKKSTTALEYEEAGKAGLPRLIFLLDKKASWPVERVDKDPERIHAFRDELGTERLCGLFLNPDDLVAKVTLALPEVIGKRRRIPDLLPYLCDRSDQEIALGDAIRRLRARPGRPVVCVVHGDEEQSHDMFLRRLRETCLPRLLEIPRENAVIESLPIEWPAHFQGTADLHRRLTLSLAEKVLHRDTESKAEIAQRFARTPSPVLVRTHVLTEDWLQHGEQILSGFLEYWRSWPDVLGNQPLLAFLFLKYQAGRTSNWFRRRKIQKLNQRILKIFGDLDLTTVDGFIGTVLPPLENVRRGEAEDWARSDETSRHCGAEEMVVEIGKLFDTWESQTDSNRIPMEKLAEKLRILLHKLNRSPEEMAV